MFQKMIIFFTIVILSTGPSLAANIIKLPEPKTIGKVSLEQAIFERRSERTFEKRELSNEIISQILWAAQGITDASFGFRSTPSAGALYPLHIYVAKKDGFFRYIPDGHKLLELSSTDKRPSLVRASLGQAAIRVAPMSIIISANFAITQAKYGPRSFRYVCMEIGHVAQNIQLQATALGLGSLPIGAFWDDVIKSSLKLPDNQEPLYIIPVGYVKK